MKAKDYLGNEFEVGDKVVYMQLGYRDFKKGVISRITKQMCFITPVGWNTEVRQFHNQVIKIEGIK